jgi:RNA polymerase sigma factor (sigma-70 family)
MNENAWLADQFEQYRGRLRAVAYRVLGSSTEADDAVQETWVRFSRSDTSAVDNLGAWLTTVVSRVCLNMLQSRRARPLPEANLDLGPEMAPSAGPGPEEEALLADSVGLALLVVLDNLTPAERVAFVLHDMFSISFDEIGPILGRNATAARQLASRARRQVQGQGSGHNADRARQARVVEAFLAASRRGDFEALLKVLHPDVVMRADRAAVTLGAPGEVRGREEVAGFTRRGRGAQAALVNGWPGAVWMPGGQLRVIFLLTVEGDSIVAIDVVAEPDQLERANLVLTEPAASPPSSPTR